MKLRHKTIALLSHSGLGYKLKRFTVKYFQRTVAWIETVVLLSPKMTRKDT